MTPAPSEYPAQLTLPAVSRAVGEVRLPGSKSISNRTLLLAALARGATTLTDVLDADDTRRMLEALTALGVRIEQDAVAGRWVVHGTGGKLPVRSAQLFLGNAGTAVRPLTAALAVLGGDYMITGVPRMHERPIGDLVDALRILGCDVAYLGQGGFPPLTLGSAGGRAGGPVPIRGDVSSQFLSALLMALPLARGSESTATRVDILGELISRPYVEITTSLMRRFGVDVVAEGAGFTVPAGALYSSPGTLAVEGDASAASYLLAAGAIGGGPVRVRGVGRDSIQGDVAFADVLARLGAEVTFGPDWIEARQGAALAGGTIDCLAIPDAAMTLAVTALFAGAPTRLINIGSWRVKETDRIAALATELRKIGAMVEEGPDWVQVTPPARFLPATVATYDDHRMAMCLSLVTLAGVPIVVDDPGCVRKTYPGYFETFSGIVT